MGTFMMRFFLMLKARLKNPYTYVWVLLMAVSLWLVNETVIPSRNSSEVVILNLAGECGDKILNILENADEKTTECTYSAVGDEETLRELVRRGQARCGFILPADLKERVLSGDARHAITMVTSTFSVKSAATRETVFAALFRVMNLEMTENAVRDYFEDPEAASELIRERYEYYLGSEEVFRLEYEVFESPESRDEGFLFDRSDPIRGTAAVILFILSLYSGSVFYGKDGKFFSALRKGERMACIFLHELSSVLIPSVFSFVIVRMLDAESVSLGRDLACFAVLVVSCCVWSGVFVSFFRKNETYLPAVSVLLFMSFALCPVFFDIGEYIPVIGYVVRILPPALYLYML
ncbi:MAG: hypothetical protein K5871_08695 [Lachnospiraceae bacterium]|nr:hypothetical protein [Lachnospiraceae bacterium]